MGQRLHQQLLLTEGVTQRCLKRVGSRLCHQLVPLLLLYCIARETAGR